jgi:hypothetical protein
MSPMPSNPEPDEVPEVIDLSLEELRTALPDVVSALARHFRITQEQLGTALGGMSAANVSRRLNGSRSFKPEEVYVLSRFFGVPAEVLWTKPNEAIRWVLDHETDPRPLAALRSRCPSSAAPGASDQHVRTVGPRTERRKNRVTLRHDNIVYAISPSSAHSEAA